MRNSARALVGAGVALVAVADVVGAELQRPGIGLALEPQAVAPPGRSAWS